jgi:hypothetical protein
VKNSENGPTGLENPPWLDEELKKLRDAFPATAIELHYPASASSEPSEYMNVDEMPPKINKTFRQSLEEKSRWKLGNQ